MDMFEHKSEKQMKEEAPLAARMRPATLLAELPELGTLNRR